LQGRLENVIKTLEKDIVELKKEIKGRDTTVLNKEKGKHGNHQTRDKTFGFGTHKSEHKVSDWTNLKEEVGKRQIGIPIF
jgi:hypothetical protein